jgi:dolichol-phosphate mannosyltransferase
MMYLALSYDHRLVDGKQAVTFLVKVKQAIEDPTRLILGVHVHDATAGFKAWRCETLKEIDLGRIRSNGYIFQVEMAYVTEKLGYRVLEVPIYFEDRRIGRSKMSVPVKLEAAWRVWELRGRYRNVTRGAL